MLIYLPDTCLGKEIALKTMDEIENNFKLNEKEAFIFNDLCLSRYVVSSVSGSTQVVTSIDAEGDFKISGYLATFPKELIARL